MSSNHATTQAPHPWTVSTQQSTKSGEERRTVDAAEEKGNGPHRNEYIIQAKHRGTP
jgi:hypothetical protein